MSTGWRPVLDEGDAATARRVAHEVAARLCDLDRVAAAIDASARLTSFPRSVHWRPEGLWQGHAGLAMLCGVVDACFPDEGFDRAGREHLQRAARALEERVPPPLGLSAGVAGVAVAAWSLSRGGTRFRNLVHSLDGALVELASARARSILHGPTAAPPVSTFDVISGLTGGGRYLLLRRDDPACREALEGVLESLVHLSLEDAGVARWHTPPEHVALVSQGQSGPGGSLNLGLAHGVPGPLALLSAAAMQGVLVDGQLDAIDRVAGVLWRLRLHDEWGVTWPTAVPLGVDPTDPVASPVASRTAWCYGGPGIARALWLAGGALGDDDLRRHAVDALEAVHRRPWSARQIDSPTFCHGVAGLQQITLRFADESGLPQFADAARGLHARLVAAHEPDSLLGYRNLEPGGARIDQAGLLDGAAGVALVLLAASTDVAPTWDATFLLS